MNRHYLREDDAMHDQERINSDLDDATNFGIGVAWIIALSIVLWGLLWFSTVHAQTITAPTRSSTYDWACLDASGAVLSTHQRFDTAFVACYNNPAGVSVQGGTYKLAARTTTPPPVTCQPPPASTARTQTCPAGTTGSWPQTSTSTVGPAPACTVTTIWAPVDAPAGACVTATPNAPTGLAAQILPRAGSANVDVKLTWAAVLGATECEVWRCVGATCTNFAFVTGADVACAADAAYTNSSVPPGFTYRYKVRGWKPTTGPFSDIVTVTVTTAPPPPAASGTATIDWEHDGANVSGYRIVYGNAADVLSNAVEVQNTALRSYVVTNLASGTWYFAVKAVNGSAESGASNVASKTIP